MNDSHRCRQSRELPYPEMVWEEGDLQALLLAAYRNLDKSARQTLLDAAVQFKPLKTGLRRMQITPVPPIVAKAIDGTHGWQIVSMLGEMLNDNVRVRRSAPLEPWDATLRQLAEAAEQLDARWRGAGFGTLWLTWLLRSCRGAEASLLAEALLRADGSFHLRALRNRSSPWGDIDGPWLRDPLSHPAAELQAEAVARMLVADLIDQHDTVEWLTGVKASVDPGDLPAGETDQAPEDAAMRSSNRDSPSLAEPSTEVSTQDSIARPAGAGARAERAASEETDDLGTLLRHLHESATSAARRLVAELDRGAVPQGEALAPIERLIAAADEIGADVGTESRDIGVLLDALQGPDEDTLLLTRLACVEAQGAAEAAADPLRAAATEALAGDTAPGALVTLARLLDQTGVPQFSELMQLQPLLAAELQPSLLAAGQGLLTLPDSVGRTAEEKSQDDRLKAATVVASDVEPMLGPDAGLQPAPDPESEPQRDPELDEARASVAADPSSADELRTSEASRAGADPVAEGTGRSVKPTEDDDVEEEDLEPGAEEVDGLIAKLLTRGDAAGAYWTAASFDTDPARTAGFEMLALARAMRREAGPAGIAFDKAATRLPAEQLLADRTASIMAVAAGLTATFVAPYTAVGSLSVIAEHFEGRENLHRILLAAVNAARVGVRLGAAPVEDVADGRREELAGVRERASHLIEAAPRRTVGYQPATRVWQRWTEPDGWLGHMLIAVRDDQRERVDHVRREREAATDRELVTRMNETDVLERGHNARGIEYHGRDALLRKTHAHLAVVDDWLDLNDRLRDDARDHSTWEERVSVELREALTEAGEAALEELSNVGDELAASAARLAAGHLASLFERMTTGRALTGREPNPDAWLARPLLRTDVPLDPTTWQPIRGLAFADLRTLTAPPSWAEAFQRRIDRDDLDEAANILPLITLEDPGLADELADQLDEAVLAAQSKVADRWRQVRDTLAGAKRQGILGADDATQFDQRLAELDVTDIAGNGDEGETPTLNQVRTDVGQVLRELRRFEAEIRQVTRRRIEEEFDELDERVAADSRLAEHAATLRGHIEAGRIAEAEELMLLVQRNEQPASSDQPEWFLPELLATTTDPTGVDSELLDALRAGASSGAFSFAELREEARARGVRTLEALQAVLSSPRPDDAKAVRTVLVGIGLDVPADGVQALEQRGTKHRWFECMTTGRGSLVRQFGSETRGRMRVLVTPATMRPPQIVDVVVAEAGGQHTILLHVAPEDLTWRGQLAKGLLASAAKPVLPLDAHLLIARASEGASSWSATCALALPWANANPYLTNVQGLALPPEAFFGRRVEQRGLLDPNGPTIVFGGRQLGKTALLRQVAAEFDAYGEHSFAIHTTIRSLGTDGDTSLLWGTLHGELAVRGIELTAPEPGQERETIVRELRRWLREDDRRRLLLLLDEADNFLVAEKPHYPNVDALKELMDNSGRQLKVVFAGLHNVTRFQRDENHPFAHLGDPIGVGGLDPEDALALLREPLAALGYVADDAVLLRAVTYANYHPAILQRVGSMLVERLQRRRDADQPPPWDVQMDDVDAVFDDQDFAEWISGLMMRTLELDDRYVVIAYAMALADRELGDGRPIARTVAQIQDACADKEATDLARRDREPEVAALLDELAVLGITRRRPDGLWELRSRYVSRMLGSNEMTLLSKLIDHAERSGQRLYDATTHRRPFASDAARISPLADREVVDLCTTPSVVKAVVGSDALGIGDVRGILEEHSAPRFGTEVFDFELGQRRAARKPPYSNRRMHRVVVSDLRSKTDRQATRAFEQATNWRTDTGLPGSVGVAILLDVRQLSTIRQMFDDPAAQSVELIALRRLDAAAIERWALDGELPHVGDSGQVESATGGWVQLLTQTAHHARSEAISLDEAADVVRQRLEEPAAAQALLTAVGFDHFDATLRQVWKLLVGYGRSDIDELEHEIALELAGGSAAEPQRAVARRERLVLDRLGLLNYTGNAVEPEPLIAKLWSNTRATPSNLSL